MFVYLDDVIIASSTEEEHFNDLRQFFTVTERYGIKLKLPKCQFAKDEVKYLGVWVSHGTIRADPDKLKAISQANRPRTITELRSFLGAANYFRKFIRNYGAMAAPLTKIQTAEALQQWGADEDEAFRSIKEALTSAPCLKTPDFSRPFIIETDASAKAVGACLLQADREGKEHPVAFASRTLKPAETRYHSMEQEALGICFALQQYAPYIEGNGVTTVRTDNSPICALLKKQELPARLRRFQLAIQGFDVKLVHRKGSSNTLCDYLSRYPTDQTTEVAAVQENDEDSEEDQEEDALQREEPPSLEEIQTEQQKIPEYVHLIEAIRQKDRKTKELYELSEGILRRRPEELGEESRILLPHALRERTIRYFHTNRIFGAHLGIEKTAEKMIKRVYWPAMKEDIKKVVTACDTCQRRKGSATQIRREPMQVSWKVDRPNEHLHTDLMGPLPTTEAGNRYVLITIDAFSKFLTATALPDQLARTVAEALVNEVFLIHSIPKTISTDNGSNFCSELFEELCQLLGTRHVRTTPYHAQSNGQAERSVQSVKNMLSTMVTEGKKEWDSYVKTACFAYNTSIHATTKQIPFYLTFGRDARLPIDADWNFKQHDKLLHTEYQATIADRLQTAWESTRRTIEEAGEKTKERYDEEHAAKERPFSIGDLVLVKVPVRQQALAPKWKGPFRIIRIQRPNLFLMDPSNHKSSRIHIDRVKRYTETAMLPLRLNDHGAEEEHGPGQGQDHQPTTPPRNSPDPETTSTRRRSPRLQGKPRPQYYPS
uniref:RNA-directed DNA polymerase n=1 Tax=Steinernema glaseri TaxID=37863 RepID=A0A1I7YFB0_9BILA